MYNVITQQTEQMRFLRLNQIDRYNYGMGDVDITNQLCVSYRLDQWIRNKKWWWSNMFWSFGVCLLIHILSTLLCVTRMVSWIKNRYTHYEFLEEVSTYWMNSEVATSESNTTASDSDSSSALATMNSPSVGSMISALTADSFLSRTSHSPHTSGTSRKKKFTNNSLGPRSHYQICLFDQTNIFHSNVKP